MSVLPRRYGMSSLSAKPALILSSSLSILTLILWMKILISSPPTPLTAFSCPSCSLKLSISQIDFGKIVMSAPESAYVETLNHWFSFVFR